MNLQTLLQHMPLYVVEVPPQLRGIVEHFSANTRFEGQVFVNESVPPGALGVFFARFDQQGSLRVLRNNCLYVLGDDDRNIVICDVDFLTDWRNSFSDAKRGEHLVEATLPSSFSTEADYLAGFAAMFASHLRYVFPRWVVGHEIGHAVLGHGAPHPHDFTDPSVRSRQSKANEFAADKFVIERMASDEKARMHFYQAITHLLNDWLVAEVALPAMALGGRSAHGDPVQIQDGSPTHPPMILRILGLIDAFLERFPDMDTTGFYQRVRSRLSVG